MEAGGYLSGIAERFFGTLADPDLRVHPLYLLAFVAAAFVLYIVKTGRQAGRPSFLAWAFPRAVYFHPSHITDIKLFLFSRLLTGIGLFSAVGAPVLSAAVVMTALSAAAGHESSGAALTPAGMAGLSVLLMVVGDFCVYWVHRVHHLTGVLWPFHAVHHSAEVMTPITVYRKHPVYDLISEFFGGLLKGGAQGLVLFFLTGRIELWMIGGVNACYFLFNMTTANFRHSHIWIGFGPVLEHVFISPAQHQIHHSRNPAHHNKNFGEILAVWDWMFGTLYIPRGEEKLDFGLANADGSPVPQPHGTLKDALIQPFRDSARVVAARRARRGENRREPGAAAWESPAE